MTTTMLLYSYCCCFGCCCCYSCCAAVVAVVVVVAVVAVALIGLPKQSGLAIDISTVSCPHFFSSSTGSTTVDWAETPRGCEPIGAVHRGGDGGRCGPHVAMDRDGDRSSGSLVICFAFASFVPMHFRCFSRMREETHIAESEEVTMSAPTLLQLTRKSIFLTWFGIQKQLSIGDH